MKNGMTKRFLASILTLCMMLSIMPTTAFAEGETPALPFDQKVNTNQHDGITLMKKAEAKSDGTVEISIGAYTTGEVVNTTTTTPTDIVLLLDVSGSMDETAETRTVVNYSAINGSRQTAGSIFNRYYRYGFSSTSTTYYIESEANDGTYVPLRYAGRDDNNYDYYSYGSQYYYPEMSGGYNEQQHKNESNYSVVQFYRRTTNTTSIDKIDLLKAAANEFIDMTVLSNADIANNSDKHRIAIVTYASNSSVRSDYVTVDATGAASLKGIINGLNANGATAIDYGMTSVSDLIQGASDSDRKDVIIAFTDGEPTHGNSFSETVANDALRTAESLKRYGATIYSVSMESSANAAVLGNDTNKFMHYLSSNYPNATEMDNPGTGGNAGYYMTPSNDQGLEEIFVKIAQSIGTPHVSMGPSATLTDSISSYFKLANGASSITLETVDKTSTGWAANGEPDDDLEYELHEGGQTIHVTGFDFDKYYVSETARTIDGNESYGKMLLIQMIVKPQDSIIDAGASVHGGNIPTNADNAYITDSNGETRAEVARPVLTVPAITYNYTINDAGSTQHAKYYRLPGTAHTILAPISRTGYTFGGWKIGDETATNFTMPNANVNITGNFGVNSYPVTYFIDNIPAGVTNLIPPTETNKNYGVNVDLKPIPDLVSLGLSTTYDFYGWYTDDATIETSKFVMPAHPVEIFGRLEPKTGINWYERHYLEILPGESTTGTLEVDGKFYKLDETIVGGIKTGDITHTGTGGTTIMVNAGHYPGFDLNELKTNEVNSNPKISDLSPENVITVTVEENLVVKFLYNRNLNDVTYKFEGEVPSGASLPTGETDVPYGKVVDVAAAPSVAGYTFSGWDTDDATISNGTFTMPDNDVVLVGRFTAQPQKYYVRHLLENLPGDNSGELGTLSGNNTKYYTLQTPVDEYTRATGALVEAEPKPYVGFHARTDNVLEGHVLPNNGLTLNVYYDRNTYNVTYMYFDDGNLTVDRPDIPPEYQKINVPYGTPLEREDPLNYTDENGTPQKFNGWYTSTATVDGSGNYTMPDHDVVFAGSFFPTKTVIFKVLNGTWSDHTTADKKVTVVFDTVNVNTKTVDVPTGMLENEGFAGGAWREDILASNPATVDVKTTDPNIVVYTYAFHKKPDVIYDEYDPEDPIPDPTTDEYLADNKILVKPNGGTWEIPTNANVAGKIPGDYVTNPTVVTLVAATTVDLGTPDNAPGKIDHVFVGWKHYETPSEQDKTTYGNDIVAVYEAQWEKDVIGENPDPDTPDNIPDMYQRKIIFKVVNGKWSDTTTADIVRVVTFEESGNISLEGSATVTVPTGMTANSGYDQSTGVWSPSVGANITVNKDTVNGTTYTYSFTPVYVPEPDPEPTTGSATLTKVDENDTSTKLANVVFELYRKNGTKIGQYTTNSKGKITIPDLDTGNYYWLEILPAQGYQIDHTKHEFTVYGGGTSNLTIKNSRASVPEVFTGDHYAYIIGMPDGLVHPEESITRAEVATIFFRLLDENTRNQYLTTQNNFPDSNEGEWFNTAVSTMTAMGVFNGLPDGTFGPNQKITRGEFAAIASRFETNGDTSDASFTDIYDHWAHKEINISANNGWVLGFDGEFKPDELITRAETMAMVNRVLQRIPESKSDLLPSMIEWPDNMNTNEWYYLMVQEATNSHDYERKASGYEYWTALTEVPDWTTYEK